jgi:putative hydrolase of HD superfamily
MSDDLLSEVSFLEESDKLKSIVRRTSLHDGSRLENSAEHSWHLALAVMTVHHLANFPVDVARATQMALIHDVVEIDAGDTFVYDQAANRDKFAREQLAAERIFGLLPEGKERLHALWLAYEKQECPESMFVAALDRFLPVLAQYKTGGAAWKRHGITKEQVLGLNQKIAKGSERLWRTARAMIEETFG